MPSLKGLWRRIGRDRLQEIAPAPSSESESHADTKGKAIAGAVLSAPSSSRSSFESSEARGAGGVAVEGAPELTARFDRLAQQGFDHLRHERLDAAATAYEEASRLAIDLPSGHPQVAELFALLGLTRLYGDDLNGAAAAVAEGKARSGQDGSAALKRVEARLLLAQGHNAEAAKVLRDAYAFETDPPTAGPGHYLLLMAETWAGLILDGLGQVDEATRQFERAEALAVSSPYPDLKATTLLNRADSAVSRGDLDLAEKLASQVVKEARGKGDGMLGSTALPDSLSYGLSVLGRSLRLQGALDRAGPILNEALSLSEEGEVGRWNRSSVKADLALLALAEGRRDEARTLAQECEEAARVSEEPGRIAESHEVWAELAAAAGNLSEVAARYRSAIEIYRQTGDSDLEAQTQRALGALPASAGS